MTSRVVLDTSVIVEYVNKAGEYHEQAKIVFDAILQGKLEAVIPHPVLAETYYVVARMYRALKLEKPEERACMLVEWLYRISTPAAKSYHLEVALEAGKAKLKYKIALTDCYVLAAAKVYGGKAVFRKREREMLNVIREIEKEYPVIFLEDYK